ncbi:MAG: YIP1 family protein [Anaerolineales bacterium]|uniref:YIP1 family protein n=1 Tax=Candidatus Desulfolinea nitratireducens TaxID=2841698 RepID=A0A8J6NIQ4_9CHLR|nr:YIP1 family protein [Candidatus Desulfolinea nitratireducens]MBL6959918.1 YIP1 family protein [Anaerolineales bacterium]
MSEIPEFLDQEPSPYSSDEPMPWYQVWIAAITKPNEQTFRDLAAQSNAKPGTAYLWIFISYLVTFIIVVGAQAAIGFPNIARQLSGYGMGDFPVEDMGGFLIGALVIAPFMAGIVVLFFMLSTALIQWIASLFGGTASYATLVYPFGAIYAPFMLASAMMSLLGLIPFIGMCFGLISIGIWVYQIVLQVLAVKAVNDLDTGKAAGAVLLPGLVLFVFVCCCLLIGLAAAGPIIGEVFSEINQGLY